MKILQKETVFTIKRFTRVNDELMAALKIYNSEMEVSLRTNINEITYFVLPSHSTKEMLREMYFFGLYYNNIVIGFSEIAFLKESKTLVIDYFVIKKEFQKNGIFFSLYNLTMGYFHDMCLDYNYVVIEATKDAFISSITQKMLFYEDYKIIEALYYQPELGNKNIESLLECDLMIYTKKEICKLKKETYILIIKDIYYNHYFDWYEKFLSKENIIKYAEQLDNLLSKVKSQISNMKEINLTLGNTIQCNYYGHIDCHYGRTSGYMPAPKVRRLPIFAIPILCVGLIIGLTVLAYIIMNYVEIDTKLFVSLFSAISATIISVITIILNYLIKK